MQIKKLAPDMEAALAMAEQRPGLPSAVNDQETAEKIESIPGAIGVVTVALITSEKRPLRALQLNGVAPTEANCKSGSYPNSMVKRFFLIHQATPLAGVQRFVTFIQSPDGLAILRKTGHWAP